MAVSSAAVGTSLSRAAKKNPAANSSATKSARRIAAARNPPIAYSITSNSHSPLIHGVRSLATVNGSVSGSA